MKIPLLVALLFPLLLSAGQEEKHVLAENMMTAVDTALRAHYSDYGFYPNGTTPEVLRALMGANQKKIVFIEFGKNQINADGNLIDPWGNAYRIAFIDGDYRMETRSAGPDGKFGTADDLATVTSQASMPAVQWKNVDDSKPEPGKPLSHRQIADRTLLELRLLDSAVDEFAIDKAKQSGSTATAGDLLKYVPKGTRLHDELEDPKGPHDLLGNSFGPFIVDKIPKVSPATAKALSDAVNDEFWGPYIEK